MEIETKALELTLSDQGQMFAGVATIRAAIFDVLDAGDCGVSWRFYEEDSPSARITEAAAITDRVLFVNAVIARVAEIQTLHDGIRLQDICDKHKRSVLPVPTAAVCGMCQVERDK